MSRTSVRKTNERGFITAEWMGAITFTMLLMVMATNVLAVQYGRGVVRSAADDGARAGARFSASDSLRQAQCEQTANQMMNDLLRGSFDENVTVSCVVNANDVQATVSAHFPAWLPLLPFDFQANSVGNAVIEKAPQ